MVIQIPGVAAQPIGTRDAISPMTAPVQDATADQLGQLGEGVGRTAQTVGFLSRALAQIENDARFKEADTEFSGFVREQKAKFVELPGRAPSDEMPKLEQRLRETRDRIAKGLGNEAQRSRFFKEADSRAESFLNWASTHAASNLVIEKRVQSQARRDAAVEDYVTNYDDPDMRKRSREAALDEVAQISQMAGWAPESSLHHQSLIDTTTKMHAGVIESMLAGNRAPIASAYLNENRDEIDSDTETKLRDRIDRATVHVRANDMAADLMGKIEGERGAASRPPDLADEGRNVAMVARRLSDQLAAGEVDQETARATLDRFRYLEANRVQARSEQVNRVLDEATRALQEQPNLSVSQLPESVQSDLRDAGIYDALDRWKQGERAWRTDPNAWNQFLSIDNEGLRAITPEQLRASLRWRLNDGDWRYAEARHRQANGLATPKDRQVMSMSDRLENGWRKMLGEEKSMGQPLTEEDRNRLQLVRQALDLEVQAFTAAKSREPDDVETQVLIDRILLDRVDSAGWWGGKTLPVGAMRPDELAGAEVNGRTVRVDQIPAEQRRRITFDLQRRRMSASQQNIVDRWVAEGMPGMPKGMSLDEFLGKHPDLRVRRADDAIKSTPKGDLLPPSTVVDPWLSGGGR